MAVFSVLLTFISYRNIVCLFTSLLATLLSTDITKLVNAAYENGMLFKQRNPAINQDFWIRDVLNVGKALPAESDKEINGATYVVRAEWFLSDVFFKYPVFTIFRDGQFRTFNYIDEPDN